MAGSSTHGRRSPGTNRTALEAWLIWRWAPYYATEGYTQIGLVEKTGIPCHVLVGVGEWPLKSANNYMPRSRSWWRRDNKTIEESKAIWGTKIKQSTHKTKAYTWMTPQKTGRLLQCLNPATLRKINQSTKQLEGKSSRGHSTTKNWSIFISIPCLPV
jgi:hypothetical protein